MQTGASNEIANNSIGNAAAAFAAVEDISALWTALVIMLLAGVIGGFAAYLTDDQDPAATGGTVVPKQRLRFLMLGLVASACVPLFLSLVRSEIMTSILTNSDGNRLESFLAFAGFCLLAAFLGRRFIDTLSERVLQQVREARVEAKRAGEKAEAADEKAGRAQDKAEDAQEAALEVADERAAEPVAADKLALRADVQLSDAAVDLTDDERSVLKALTRLSFRTATGAAVDAGIARHNVGEILDSLVEKGLAEMAPSPTTKRIRWTITPAGIAALKR
jgi:hypothetical protein